MRKSQLFGKRGWGNCCAKARGETRCILETQKAGVWGAGGGPERVTGLTLKQFLSVSCQAQAGSLFKRLPARLQGRLLP